MGGGSLMRLRYQSREFAPTEILSIDKVHGGLSVHIRSTGALAPRSVSPRAFTLCIGEKHEIAGSAVSVGADFSHLHLDVFFELSDDTQDMSTLEVRWDK
jgi:hypothetical protein